MANVFKQLYKGQLPTAVGAALYTVPAGKAAIIANFGFQDIVGTQAQTITIYQGGTTSADIIRKIIMAAGGSADWKGPKNMAAGDTIYITTTSASTVNCLIEGNEVG